MKKAMLSQPMAGKTNEEIVSTREKAVSVLNRMGYEVVNTLFTDEWYSKENGGTRGCANSSVLPCKVTRKHEPVPHSVFLQGMGKCPWMQNRA